jgi:hypothetical protein
MRIYEGAPRQNYEEVLRSIGALLDQRGMREVTLAETDDGFLVQGLALVAGENQPWNDPTAQLTKESYYLREDDIGRFMEEGINRRHDRRGTSAQRAANPQQPGGQPHAAGFYEVALRVVGAYVDQQQPRDLFFFEQDRQFVMRLLMPTRTGLRHVLVEFTADEIISMINAAQRARGQQPIDQDFRPR